MQFTERDATIRVQAVELGNPFPGLRPFREDEEHLFFGRESQVDSMVDKLAATRFLTVVGTSGSGKSSLVNCGLRPALHRGLLASAGTSWRIARFRPGGSPLRSMARAGRGQGAIHRIRSWGSEHGGRL
jgi:ABC-type phosphonate transport system ATPase subunit